MYELNYLHMYITCTSCLFSLITNQIHGRASIESAAPLRVQMKLMKNNDYTSGIDVEVYDVRSSLSFSSIVEV